MDDKARKRKRQDESCEHCPGKKVPVIIRSILFDILNVSWLVCENAGQEMDEQNSCAGFSCTWNYLQVREDGLEFFTVCTECSVTIQRNVGTVLVHEDFASCNNY